MFKYGLSVRKGVCIQLLLGSINTILDKVKITVLCSIVNGKMEAQPTVVREFQKCMLAKFSLRKISCGEEVQFGTLVGSLIFLVCFF